MGSEVYNRPAVDLWLSGVLRDLNVDLGRQGDSHEQEKRWSVRGRLRDLSKGYKVFDLFMKAESHLSSVLSPILSILHLPDISLILSLTPIRSRVKNVGGASTDRHAGSSCGTGCHGSLHGP